MTQDLLILVDEQDNEIGLEEKVAAHLGEAKLHRAFSLFLFDDENRLLLQQRANSKMLWPGFWSNSVCSHPRKGETVLVAAERRLAQELNAEATDYRAVSHIVYSARYKDIGSEREYCHIVFAKILGGLRINPEEVQAVRWERLQNVFSQIEATPDTFTPWFKLELEHLKKLNVLP